MPSNSTMPLILHLTINRWLYSQHETPWNYISIWNIHFLDSSFGSKTFYHSANLFFLFCFISGLVARSSCSSIISVCIISKASGDRNWASVSSISIESACDRWSSAKYGLLKVKLKVREELFYWSQKNTNFLWRSFPSTSERSIHSPMLLLTCCARHNNTLSPVWYLRTLGTFNAWHRASSRLKPDTCHSISLRAIRMIYARLERLGWVRHSLRKSYVWEFLWTQGRKWRVVRVAVSHSSRLRRKVVRKSSEHLGMMPLPSRR